MVKEICIISTHLEFTEKINRILKEINEDIEVHTAIFEDAVKLCRELMNEGASIFISRGGNKKYIEKRLGIPIVNINYNISDYMEAFKIAKYAKGKVGIFSYEKKLDDIDTVAKLLDIDINHYIFNDINECEDCVLQAQKDGIVLGIGGSVTGRLAKALGMDYITVESSKDSIINAINTAKQLLQVKKEESKKKETYRIQMEKYKTILNFTHDGIVAIDENKKISAINPVAEKLMGISSEAAVGTDVNVTIPNTRLGKVIETGTKEINDIMEINNRIICTNRIPIVIDGKVKGVVATFQDVNKLQEREQKIRVKLHKKGLVAKYDFNDIIGKSKSIRNTIYIAKNYAKTSSTILICGETGTGKELLAQSIHNNSRRKSGPFVAVNCAALPKNLLESELFGYVEGAFTGATKGGKIGLFELAHRGTIFLDEIAEVPLEVQAQLLRVLQEKEIRRLGSDRIIPVDIRVIAATNKNLEKEIKDGRFREDLYYRINVLRLQVPPLRARENDLIYIGISFLKKLNYQFYMENSKTWNMILRELLKYPWYGNIRELQNVLERIAAILLGGDGMTKDYYEIIDEIMSNEYKGDKPIMDKKVYEKKRIEQALINNNWCRDKAAEELGISRTTLWRKLKKYNMGT